METNLHRCLAKSVLHTLALPKLDRDISLVTLELASFLSEMSISKFALSLALLASDRNRVLLQVEICQH